MLTAAFSRARLLCTSSRASWCSCNGRTRAARPPLRRAGPRARVAGLALCSREATQGEGSTRIPGPQPQAQAFPLPLSLVSAIGRFRFCSGEPGGANTSRKLVYFPKFV